MSTSELQFLQEHLDLIYKRPARCVCRAYAEEYGLVEIAQRPGVREELAEIEEYRSRLPAKERRFFPRSMQSLISKWQEVLDQARVYEPNPQDRSIVSKAVDRLAREVEKE